MFYYNSEQPSSSYDFGKQLFQLISSEQKPDQSLVFLCIGSDRATGDSLGPLIGYKLQHRHPSTIHIYGTLEEPVHAKNLPEVIQQIYQKFHRPYIIAIDASLGSAAHVGYFTLAKGSLRPGAGVGKELPQIGSLYVTGIVNLSGFLEHSLLQTTRLQVVMNLADHITAGILYCLTQLQKKYYC